MQIWGGEMPSSRVLSKESGSAVGFRLLPNARGEDGGRRAVLSWPVFCWAGRCHWLALVSLCKYEVSPVRLGQLSMFCLQILQSKRLLYLKKKKNKKQPRTVPFLRGQIHQNKPESTRGIKCQMF